MKPSLNSPYTVITASAGSGKTYKLVQQILMLCLKEANAHSTINHILALTFTNKAANEMKERLINWLTRFTSENYEQNPELQSLQKELENNKIKVSLAELKNRSQKLLDHILHNYSSLSISTIDKFNSRLIRSFSYEMGLAHQFSIEIKSEPFIRQAVDLMLEQIADDSIFSKQILNYIHNHLQEDSKPDLKRTILTDANTFISDTHAPELERNKDLNWENYQKINTELNEKLAWHRTETRRLAKESAELITQSNLDSGDFFGKSQSGIGDFFLVKLPKQLNEKKIKLPKFDGEENKEANFRKGPSKESQNPSAVFEIIDTLIFNRSQIFKHYAEEKKLELIRPALLSLTVNSEVRDLLAQIEKENDLVLLSKFNLMIEKHLKNEPSQFIYEKIGTRYFHYFLDEFQDTSRLQWTNLDPLRLDAIHTQGKSFTLVGDPKQSIYRFRGGDSSLMFEILNSTNEEEIPVKEIALDTNYRSAKNIISFNNELYRFLSKDLSSEHQKLFGAKASQNSHREALGRVKIQISDTTNNPDYQEETVLRMQADIQECLNNGYSFSDITILCSQNNQIAFFAKSLGLLQVDYNGNPTPIKTLSEKGLTLGSSLTLQAIIEFLSFQNKPSQKQHLVKCLYFLNLLGRIRIQDFSSEMHTLVNLPDIEVEPYIESHYQLKLQASGLSSLSLYTYIEYYTQEFSHNYEEQGYILTFLEEVSKISYNQSIGIDEFLEYWEQDGNNQAVQGSENIDAIRLMTIHSAKGLEFPIVLLPMFNSRISFKSWYELDQQNELKSVYLKQFNKDLVEFDPHANEFNAHNQYEETIDQLCKFYVATTRPTEQLFLYLQKNLSIGTITGLSTYLQGSNSNSSFDLFHTNDAIVRKISTKKTDSQTQILLTRQEKDRSKNSAVKIATPSKSYQSKNDQVRTGIFVHEILEKITTTNDISTVLDHYVLEGTLTFQERKAVEDRIRRIVNDTRYTDYFAPGNRVRNEKELIFLNDLTPQLARVDRIIETDQGLIIIDFKTGEPSSSHQKQLNLYKTALESFGEKVIKTEIIYL